MQERKQERVQEKQQETKEKELQERRQSKRKNHGCTTQGIYNITIINYCIDLRDKNVQRI